MTTYDYRSTTDNDSAADQARQVASTAADESKHVAEVAKDEARHVAADAQAQARDLLNGARAEVENQTRTQLESLVGTLQGFAEDLEKMARGEGAGSGLARDVVQQVGDKAKAFGSELRDREPGELLDQARDYARRKPGTFLLGALAAGVVAGRLARGAKEAQGSGGSQQTGPGTPPGLQDATSTAALPSSPPPPPPSPAATGSAPQAGTATADPLAGVGQPQGTPEYPEGTRSSATQWGTP